MWFEIKNKYEKLTPLRPKLTDNDEKTSVATDVFRTYKKGSDFKELAKEYNFFQIRLIKI